MAERIRTTHIDNPNSNTTVVEREIERPVYREEPRRSGMGWVGRLLILTVLVAGIFIAIQFLQNDRMQSDAIADAANDVGAAARQIGDAAESAGEAAKDAVGQ